MTTFSPVSCFSYLASVHTLNVERYPEINYGVEVLDSDQFLAGDGPLVAGFLRALGHQATLGSNQVGDDTAGRDILTRLYAWDVTLAPSTMSVTRTRTNVVVCDRDGNRTWFSGLRGIVPELADIDVRALASAPTVYIDCYEVLETAPRALLRAALDAGAEIVLNLGGSPPPRWLAAAAGGRRVSVAQTNGDENDPAKAPAHAQYPDRTWHSRHRCRDDRQARRYRAPRRRPGHSHASCAGGRTAGPGGRVCVLGSADPRPQLRSGAARLPPVRMRGRQPVVQPDRGRAAPVRR